MEKRAQYDCHVKTLYHKIPKKGTLFYLEIPETRRAGGVADPLGILIPIPRPDGCAPPSRPLLGLPPFSLPPLNPPLFAPNPLLSPRLSPLTLSPSPPRFWLALATLAALSALICCDRRASPAARLMRTSFITFASLYPRINWRLFSSSCLASNVSAGCFCEPMLP